MIRPRLRDRPQRHPPPATGHALHLMLHASDRLFLIQQLGRCLTRLSHSPHADDRMWATDIQRRLERHLARNKADQGGVTAGSVW